MIYYDIAKKLVGTPHINGGNVAGAGLDCCTLPAMIIKEATGKEIKIDFGYSPDWYMRHNHEELLLPYLLEYFEEVHELQEGDLISYRWGRSDYAHLAMYIKPGVVVHCAADNGVEITEITNHCFVDGKGRNRATGYWRLKT